MTLETATPDTDQTASPLPDYEKLWMTIGKLTTDIEALSALQAQDANTIQRILNNFGRFDADQRKHRGRITELEQECKARNSRIKDLENELHEEWGRMKPAIAAVEALAQLLPDKAERCSHAAHCELR